METQRENIIKTKTFSFALKIVKCCKFIIENKREYILSKQFLRSGTAIGALVRESEQAESKADFIHKLSIALKEACETDYWIDLINEGDYFNESEFTDLKNNIQEIIRILVAIIKKSKANR